MKIRVVDRDTAIVITIVTFLGAIILMHPVMWIVFIINLVLLMNISRGSIFSAYKSVHSASKNKTLLKKYEYSADENIYTSNQNYKLSEISNYLKVTIVKYFYWINPELVVNNADIISDLGFTERDLNILGTRIHDDFNVTIDFTNAYDHLTLNDLAYLIKEKIVSSKSHNTGKQNNHSLSEENSMSSEEKRTASNSSNNKSYKDTETYIAESLERLIKKYILKDTSIKLTKDTNIFGELDLQNEELKKMSFIILEYYDVVVNLNTMHLDTLTIKNLALYIKEKRSINNTKQMI